MNTQLVFQEQGLQMLDLALMTQVVVWLLFCGLFVAGGQASIFHPCALYLMFHGVVFVARPLMVSYLQFDSVWHYMQFGPTEAQFIHTLVVSSAGLAVFMIACLLAGWSRVRFEQPVAPEFTREQKLGLLWTTFLLSPLVLYSMYRVSSGYATGKNIGGVYVMTGDTGYVLEAQFMGGALMAAWMAVKRFRGWSLIPLVAYVVYRAQAGRSRWSFVLLLGALAMIYAWQQRKRIPPIWLAVAILPVFLLFHSIGKNRAYLRLLFAGEDVPQAAELYTAPEAERIKLKYDVLDFANFDMLAFVLAVVPDRSGVFTYGVQYLQLATEPIPRKLWPGKPVGAPVRSFSLNAFGNFMGLTVTSVGDAWISGGWIGLVGIMSFLGGVLGWAHRWFWRNQHDPWKCVLYITATAMLIQLFRDGGVVSIAKFLFWNLSPLLIWVALSWLLGPRLVPGASILLSSRARLRLVKAGGAGIQANNPSVHSLSGQGVSAAVLPVGQFPHINPQHAPNL